MPTYGSDAKRVYTLDCTQEYKSSVVNLKLQI